MTRSIGPKEAALAALRQGRRAPRGHIARVIADKTVPKPRKPGLGEPKRMGRPPRLKAADYEAVGAATPDELAVALRWYRAQLAGARKRRLDTTA